MALLNLHCCMGSPFIVVRGVYSSLQGVGFSCCGAQALGCVGFSCCNSWALARSLDSYGARAELLHSMWDLLQPETEPLFLHWQLDSLPLSHQGSPKLFLKKMIFLFIWLCWVLVAAHEIFIAHSGPLWSVDSLLVATGLVASQYVGSYFPDQGLNPHLLFGKSDS